MNASSASAEESTTTKTSITSNSRASPSSQSSVKPTTTSNVANTASSVTTGNYSTQSFETTAEEEESTTPTSVDTSTHTVLFESHYSISFQGQCSLLDDSTFYKNLISSLIGAIAEILGIRSETISVDSISCGSIVVEFTVRNVAADSAAATQLVSHVEQQGINLTLSKQNGNQVTLTAYSIIVLDLVTASTSLRPPADVNIQALIIIAAVAVSIVFIILLTWMVCRCRRQNLKKKEQLALTNIYGNIDYSMCDITVSHRMTELAGLKYESEPIY